MATIGTGEGEVDVFEQANSPTFSLAMDGRETCTVVVHCAWADWPDAWIALKAGGGMQCPHRDYLWCRDIAVEPIPAKHKLATDPAGWSDYELAKLTIQFSSPSYELPQYAAVGALSILVSERTEPTIEAAQLPIALADGSPLFTWSDNAELKEGENPIRQVYGIDYQQTHHSLTQAVLDHENYTSYDAALSLMGKVNKEDVVTYLLGGLTFGPESLLCKPPIIESAGAGLVTIHYRFKAVVGGWNSFWRPDKKVTPGPPDDPYYGAYDTIKIAGEDEQYLNHPLGDFSSL